MSLFAPRNPEPSPDHQSDGQLSFNTVELVRDCVQTVAHEGRPTGNLGNIDNALTMLTHYLARKESGGVGLCSSIQETLESLDMMKQVDLLSGFQGWDRSGHASWLAVARENRLIDLYLKTRPHEPVAVFSDRGKAGLLSLQELDKNYRARLTDEGALVLARAIMRDYAPVSELGRRSFDEFLKEQAEAEGKDFDAKMQSAISRASTGEVFSLQEEAREALDRRSQAGEAMLKSLDLGNVSDQLNQARFGIEEQIRAANLELAGEIDLDNCSAQQLLAIAKSPGLVMAFGEERLTDAMIEKVVDLRKKLCVLESSFGLACDPNANAQALVLEDLRLLNDKQAAGENQVTAIAELLRCRLQNYQRFSGEENYAG